MDHSHASSRTSDENEYVRARNVLLLRLSILEKSGEGKILFICKKFAICFLNLDFNRIFFPFSITNVSLIYRSFTWNMIN